MDDYCEDCEAPFNYCDCGEDPAEYIEAVSATEEACDYCGEEGCDGSRYECSEWEPPDPGELYDYHDERAFMESSGSDYWQNDAGEWRLG